MLLTLYVPLTLLSRPCSTTAESLDIQRLHIDRNTSSVWCDRCSTVLPISMTKAFFIGTSRVFHGLLNTCTNVHLYTASHSFFPGSNILLNSRGVLKLADFGLARHYMAGRRLDFTNRVITLWYRPPELLLGATEYGPEVDLWGIGYVINDNLISCTEIAYDPSSSYHRDHIIHHATTVVSCSSCSYANRHSQARMKSHSLTPSIVSAVRLPSSHGLVWEIFRGST